jgi:DNA replication ATP-dependent helicase Dna2
MESKKVVACTCLGVGHAILARMPFDICIVDEASQIPLPVCVAVLRFADKFVLVGDDQQLPPLVRSSIAKEHGMEESLFTRLTTAHPHAVCTY